MQSLLECLDCLIKRLLSLCIHFLVGSTSTTLLSLLIYKLALLVCDQVRLATLTGLLAEYTFLLTDPRAVELNTLRPLDQMVEAILDL